MSKCLRAGAVRGVGAPSRRMMVPMGCASAQELFYLVLAFSMSCFPMYQTKVMLSSQGPSKDHSVYKERDVTAEGNEMG